MTSVTRREALIFVTWSRKSPQQTVSVPAAGDAASDCSAAMIATNHVEPFGGPEQAGNFRVQVKELDVRFLSELFPTFGTVYHALN